MLVAALGLNHETAPVAVRERLALSDGQLAEALSVLTEYVKQGALLSTCNRTEVYAVVGHRRSGRENIRRFLCDYFEIPDGEVSPYLYVRYQEEAARHLFRVAAGIDSMILGEEQILGQVRNTMKAALAQGTLGPVLANLFRRALSVGKRARTHTGISRKAVSVSSAAVRLAQERLGGLEGATVLVVGAGETGKLTARNLRAQGASQILVLSRTYERAATLAEDLGGTALGFERLNDALSQADIVISSTSAPRFIIRAEALSEALAARGGRPIILIDIAVPRDIDPAAAKVNGVTLYDIDALNDIARRNMGEREKEVAAVEEIVEAEVRRFMAWWDTLEVLPTVKALRSRAEAVRRQELNKTLSRLPNLGDEERWRLEALTAAIVKKLLHQPTVCLKHSEERRRYARVVRELFELPAEGPA